jgi:hypothetical protein
MKNAAQIDSCIVIRPPNFIEIGSGIRKLMGVARTYRDHGDLRELTCLLSTFFLK